ncbi:MAG: carbohydrate ABC transporter permease [Chloroflexi bacterium]|nr:carbohydrate ABC transporter permease [Chloroflexota bacterium]
MTCLVCAIIVFPFYWMVISSLQPTGLFTWPPNLVPRTISFDAYVHMFARRPIGLWLANTALVSIGTTLLSLVISINAALSLSRFRTRQNATVGVVVLGTQMLPATLLVVPVYVIFRSIGLLDSLPGLALSNTAFVLPLSIWLLKGFFDSIPFEIEEAALVDGCNRLQAFYRVVVPLALPGVLVSAVYAFLLSWDEFFFARTFINSETRWVLSVGLSSFVGEHTVEWNEMMAAAVVFSIPPTLLFFLVQRHFVQGVAGGAVKG